MPDLSMGGVVKSVPGPQKIYENIYSVMLFGLHYMPTKPVVVATATIVSAAAFYLVQPETVLAKMSVITISSGFGWAATEAAHHIGSKLWREKVAEQRAKYNETAQAMETKLKIEGLNKKMVDKLFSDSFIIPQ